MLRASLKTYFVTVNIYLAFRCSTADHSFHCHKYVITPLSDDLRIALKAMIYRKPGGRKGKFVSVTPGPCTNNIFGFGKYTMSDQANRGWTSGRVFQKIKPGIIDTVQLIFNPAQFYSNIESMTEKISSTINVGNLEILAFNVPAWITGGKLGMARSKCLRTYTRFREQAYLSIFRGPGICLKYPTSVNLLPPKLD